MPLSRKEVQKIEKKIRKLAGDMPIIMNVKLTKLNEGYKINFENKHGIFSYNTIKDGR